MVLRRHGLRGRAAPLEIYAELERRIGEAGIPLTVELAEEPHGESAGLKKSGCHGFCEMGPLVRIEPEGWLYTRVTVDDCAEIVAETVGGGRPVERLAYQQEGKIYLKQQDIPFYRRQMRKVLEHCGATDATPPRHTWRHGGYRAMETALFDRTPEEIVDEVSKFGLRGRGGGGFNPARKVGPACGRTAPVKLRGLQRRRRRPRRLNGPQHHWRATPTACWRA
jgi:NADH-quinone oxidoreductase subunit F